MNMHAKFDLALPVADFLARHGSAADSSRWKVVYENVVVTEPQRELLSKFRRDMHVLVLAGAWCGDCVRQCPIFDRFAEIAPALKIRYLDRDVHHDVQAELSICGGKRVPVVVFFSEDGHEVARYGDRTLSTYRSMMEQQVGEACLSGIVGSQNELLAQVTQDWLDQFERAQWILRLSPRLRQKHHD